MILKRNLFPARALLAAILAGAVVHILATLAAPSFVEGSVHASLARQLPVNAMRILPVVSPTSQPLPFLAPDARYAVCLFDLRNGPVAVAATLPEAGWSVAIYTARGDGLYAVPGVDERETRLSLVLVPAGDRFIGQTREARTGVVGPQIESAAETGIVVVRAPQDGVAFASRVEAVLRTANCTQIKV
jgi:uncharacterized membrane protein